MLRNFFKNWLRICVDYPRVIIFFVIIFSIFAAMQLPKIKVDTDPENMLPKTELVRRVHHFVKKRFNLHDYIVLGVVNDKDRNGVFNVRTLNNIYAITKKILSINGVVEREVISLATKDDIRKGALGEVIFEYLMPSPISGRQSALRIRDQAMNNPLFYGTIVSEDGKAAAIYIPIKSKDLSYKVAQEIRKILSNFKGNERYFITGLPVAEDTFGVEMFKQMAISAPLAALVIFLLMYWFFKSLILIFSPMLVAFFTVVITMGLLIGFGFPVHIMSSMIPIFLMPIAVLDSIHILSEFFDRYKLIGDKKQTVLEVLDELFVPMLYTSLTSAAGFFSLSFSPIPPVQVFGVFVAIGVMIAWLLTVSFIPAYVSLLPEETLLHFGKGKTGDYKYKWLMKFGQAVVKHKVKILVGTIVLLVFSVIGISKIEINDNPVKWFVHSHPIRIADKVLNKHFSGTYMVYLVLESKKGAFLDPKNLKYVAKLQEFLHTHSLCGKSSSLVDIVKKVYASLMGSNKYYKIPPTSKAVAQCLISFENSHKPDDLWHFTTPSYDSLNLWIQLKSGDNKNVAKLVKAVQNFFSNNPAPIKMRIKWAGLTYINLVWQNKMVLGMFKNFLGSFFIVLFMMMFLFKSPVLAWLSMVPLTITILFIYGLLGWFGKSYDMPVAVLSALTLGLSIDFAIHFIERVQQLYYKHFTGKKFNYAYWEIVIEEFFSSPAMAIIRNALVVAIGFLPLLAAPLIPYKTVGFFMFTIMASSAVITLVLLPAIISLYPQLIFGKFDLGSFWNKFNCFIMSISIALLLLYLLIAYWGRSFGNSIIISGLTLVVLLVGCLFLARVFGPNKLEEV